MYKLYILLFSISVFGFTQETGTVMGTISESIDNSPLSEAQIEIENLAMGTTSDKDGLFSLKNVPVGNQVLTISYIGYKTVSLNILVAAIARTEFKFQTQYGYLNS